MQMMQKGIKNVNTNEESGPEHPNTKYCEERWMNSWKSGNLELHEPKYYSSE